MKFEVKDGVLLDGTFSRNDSVVKIPEGVVTIATKGLVKRKEVKEVIFPSSLRVIEEFAFSHNTGLERIIIPPGVTKIQRFAFVGCSSLKSVQILGGTDIGIAAFAWCTALSQLEMPYITGLGSGAFRGCTSLTSAILPTSLPQLDYDTFGACDKLERIVIQGAETKILSFLEFISYPALDEIVVPKGEIRKQFLAPNGCKVQEV